MLRYILFTIFLIIVIIFLTILYIYYNYFILSHFFLFKSLFCKFIFNVNFFYYFVLEHYLRKWLYNYRYLLSSTILIFYSTYSSKFFEPLIRRDFVIFRLSVIRLYNRITIIIYHIRYLLFYIFIYYNPTPSSFDNGVRERGLVQIFLSYTLIVFITIKRIRLTRLHFWLSPQKMRKHGYKCSIYPPKHKTPPKRPILMYPKGPAKVNSYKITNYNIHFEKKRLKYLMHQWKLYLSTRVKAKLKKKKLKKKKKLFRLHRISSLKYVKNMSIINILLINNFNFIIVYMKNNFILTYKLLELSLLSLLLSLIYLYYSIIYFQIPYIQFLSIWIVLGFLFLWLLSGFNFFLKRYKYGKFTSSIQRFWKRTNLAFWFIEFVLFVIFFYYYLNSSKEPNFMFDYFHLNNDIIINSISIIYNLFFMCFIIFVFIIILLSLSFFNNKQLTRWVFFLSILIYTLFLYETYQFYYLICNFIEIYWDLNIDLQKEGKDSIWSLEDEDKKFSRVKTYYFSICLLAKYWHFLFIVISWYFFLIKSVENSKITYTLLSYNLQNFIILFFLNLLCYIDILSWLICKYIEIPYIWFFSNYDILQVNDLFYEIYMVLNSNFFFNIDTFKFDYIYNISHLWNINNLYSIQITEMLIWKCFYIVLIILNLLNIIYSSYKLLFLFLNTELLIIVIFYFLFYLTVYFNVYWLIGFALVYLFLGSLELALCMLIINL